MLDLLNNLVSRFNSKFDADPELREKLWNIDRTIQIELDEDVFYHLKMVGGKIVDVMESAVKEPDLRIITDRMTFEGILTGNVKPLKAYALQRIKIKGSLKDRLLLKDLLSSKKKDKKVEE